ncbi:MAG: DUF3038 domain-containing protein [Jaaginema sp. PMC 1079.18]|nr:DUF3038 domain-containing protein [Jaaginema sp. PMC 1080.18]MEC4852108.1 DUF3038 domain-containing protein [Jaaginema sp. PMC 1079.18]MEC4868747.1 DUF3038 domain-containing protein [Jaaginema sp. PMC 1078.18]
MRRTARPPSLALQLNDLPLSIEPSVAQLDNIKAHLDLVLMALESLTQLSSEAMLKAAESLGLQDITPDRVTLWRLRQANPHRKSSGGRKKLDVEEARSLVLIICRLAQEYQELIRRAVSLLEQRTQQHQPPHQAALLGDYLDAFSNTYHDRMDTPESTSPQALNQLAFKLLIDLLFYSDPNGHRRLWLALLDYSR